jgi:hypothetical protein
VKALLRAAAGAAKDMAGLHAGMMADKAAAAGSEKEALAQLQGLLVQRRVRELADRKAHLARLMAEAAAATGSGPPAPGSPGAGGGGSGGGEEGQVGGEGSQQAPLSIAESLLLAGAGAGFVSGSALRARPVAEELPSSVTDTLRASRRNESALSALAAAADAAGLGPSGAGTDASALLEGSALGLVVPPLPLGALGSGGAGGGASRGGGLLPPAALSTRSPLRAGSPTYQSASQRGLLQQHQHQGMVGDGEAGPLSLHRGALAASAASTGHGGPGVASPDLSAIAASEGWQRQIRGEAAAHAAAMLAGSTYAFSGGGVEGGGGVDEEVLGVAGEGSGAGQWGTLVLGSPRDGAGASIRSSSAALQEALIRVPAAAAPARDARFLVPASAGAPQAASPLLSSLGVRPSTLKSPGLRYPVPRGAGALVKPPHSRPQSPQQQQQQEPQASPGRAPHSAKSAPTAAAAASPAAAAARMPNELRASPVSRRAGRMLMAAGSGGSPGPA